MNVKMHWPPEEEPTWTKRSVAASPDFAKIENRVKGVRRLSKGHKLNEQSTTNVAAM